MLFFRRPLPPSPGPGAAGPTLRLTRSQYRTRLVLAIVVLVAGASITFTDLHGRAQVSQSLQSLARAHHHLVDTEVALANNNIQTTGAFEQLESIESSTLDTDDSITEANSSTNAADVGIFYDGISVSALDGCLSGVVQALDQVAVGQDSGAIASLGAVAPVCGAVQA